MTRVTPEVLGRLEEVLYRMRAWFECETPATHPHHLVGLILGLQKVVEGLVLLEVCGKGWALRSIPYSGSHSVLCSLIY